MPGEE